MKKHIIKIVFLLLFVAVKGNLHAQNDLPSPSANIETIPSGAWVIPMDNTWQGTGGIMNLKAYGLVNQLLWNDIHVKWAIKAGKAQDSCDFRVNSTLNFPSLDTSTNRLPGQNFETTTYVPNWAYSASGASNTTANKYNGGVSWRMGKNQNVTMTNTSLTDFTNVQLSVAFASNGNIPVTGDLYLDISYDNGTTWTGTGSVKLAAGDGSTSFNINTTNGNTVASNPYVVNISNTASQINVRLRTTNTGTWPGSAFYYVDDIKLTGTSNRGFASGPFIIMPADTAAARPIINTYNSPLAAASKVNVYKMNTSANIDIRYTLVHKPLIAVYDDGGNANIHTVYLTNAGISNTYYDTLGSGHMIDSLSCYTFACTPHWNPGTYSRSDSLRLNGLAAFVRNGANFLAECEGVDAVEGYSPYRYMSTAGFNNLSKAVTTLQYMNMDLPVMQINGAFVAQGGSEQNWNLTSGSYKSPRYKGLYFIYSGDTANIVNVTKCRANNLVGGMMIYLGGHSYNGTGIGDVNGQRIFLNSLFLPSRNFATSCNPVSNSPVCIGDTLKLYGNPPSSGLVMSWTGPNSYTSSSQNPTIPNMTTGKGGTYTFTITTNDHSCSYAFGTVVVVPTKPAITVSNSNTTICEGDSVTLSLSSTTGLSTASWYIDTAATCRPTGSPIGSGFTLKVYPTSTTKYIGVGFTSTGNCADTTTNCVTVTVDKKPVLTSVDPTSSKLCYGRGTRVTITPGSGGSGCSDSYQWRQDAGSWSSYTSGTKVGTTARDSVEVKATRTCTSGCNVVVRLKWNVSVQQTAAGSGTLLNCATSGGYIASLTSTNPSPSTGTWVVASGPGTVAAPTSYSTTIGNLSKTGATTTLYWVATNADGCKDSASTTITPPVMDSATVSKYSSSYCSSCPATNGNKINYYDVNGKLIASVTDSNDATSIGQTDFCARLNYPVSGDPSVSNVQTLDTWIDGAGHVPQPYLPRAWTINTTNDAPMTVSIFLTDQEIAALQGATMNHGNYYYFDTAPELLLAAYPNNSDTFIPAGSPGGLVIRPTFTRVDGMWQVTFRIAQSATFYIYPSFWDGSALPVELISFEAAPADRSIKLTWATATEMNNLRFDIERSTDAVNFKKIGEVAGAGNSKGMRSYTYYDENVEPGIVYYYRLNQVDTDHKSSYSKLRKAMINGASEGTDKLAITQFMPNPTNRTSKVNVHSNKFMDMRIKIFTMDGTMVRSNVYLLNKGDNEVVVDMTGISIGAYVVQFSSQDGIEIRKLIKME